MIKIRIILISIILVLSASTARATPKVLATIKPVHSLVASVMQGAGAPDLLIQGAQSAHSYALKPSDARKVEGASLIFIVGLGLENYLDAPLKNLTRGKVVKLADSPGVKVLPARRGGLWQDGESEDHRRHGGSADPHFWLDPQNAIAATYAIATALAQTDPAHGGLYRANAARTAADLTRLDQEIRRTLIPLQGKRYLVFHDAYQYFEARYALTPTGAVAADPDRPVGPRRIAELRHMIVERQAACIFREPQFPPKLIDTLTGNGQTRVGVLDPLGADLKPGPGLYPALMRGLAGSLVACLNR
jgi:zinc transport system substrate-binding protein